MAEGFDAEIKKYTEQLGKDPTSRAFVPLSDIYRKLGRYEESIAVAQDGLQKHPHYVGGKMALARAYFEYGELEKARELLEGVIRFSPDNLMANRVLAEIYVQAGLPTQAVPLLKRLLAMEPHDERARAQLTQLEMGPTLPPSDIRPETTAATPLAPATDTPPFQPPTHTATLADLYRRQGHYEKAIDVYRSLGQSEKVLEVEKEIVELRTKSNKKPVTKQLPETFLRGLLNKIQERRRKAA